VHYPADYGFVMDTIGGDGDPLDALVVVEEPTFPGCVVPARPIGTYSCATSTATTRKFSRPRRRPAVRRGQSLGDLGKHWLREIETFFATYKELESNKSADVKGWHDAEVAWKLIGEARDRARVQRRES